MKKFWDRLVDELFTIGDLPTFPSVVLELEGVVRDESSSASDVAKIIETDPSLTANVLRVANSAFFMGRGEISSVQQAVAWMGLVEITKISMSVAVLQTFGGLGKSLDHARFWKHSVMSGFVARTFRQLTAARNPLSAEEALGAGLLHDMGLLILDQFFHEDYLRILARSEGQGCDFVTATREVLGVDHGEVGGYVMERWNLPPNMMNAVMWQFQPEECPSAYRFPADSVRFASLVCETAEAEMEEDERFRTLFEAAPGSLDLSEGDLRKLLELSANDVDASLIVAME